jgi:hypothetical protein
MRFATPIFAAAGLAGPLIGLALWPSFEASASGPLANFTYDLIFYLWPTQVLGLYESSIGSIYAQR